MFFKATVRFHVYFPVDRLMKDLENGSFLYKVKSSRRLLKRQFFLDTLKGVFFYKGSRNKKKNTKSMWEFYFASVILFSSNGRR